VLTYSANDKTYRVWDMTNYDELYKLPEDEITEIKISPGIMLLILSRRDGHIPLKVTNPNPKPNPNSNT
jgi:WD40 repeat protein